MAKQQTMLASEPIDDPDHLCYYFDPNDICADAGTKFILDPTREECWPSQINPLNGDRIKDLAGYDIATNSFPDVGTIHKTGGDGVGMTFTGQGFYIPKDPVLNPGTVGNYINIGGVSDFRLRDQVNQGVVIIAYIKWDDDVAYGVPIIAGRGTNRTAPLCEFYFDRTNASYSLAGGFSDGATLFVASLAVGPQTSFAALKGQIVQVALSSEWDATAAGWRTYIYINKVLSAQSATVRTLPYNTVSSSFQLGGTMAGTVTTKGLFSRTVMHELNSGYTALEKITQDYDTHFARIVAAA